VNFCFLSTASNILETFIPIKNASLESSIRTLQDKLLALNTHVEEKSWLNEIGNIWSVHVIDRDCTKLNDKRARVYRCIENIVQIKEMEESDDTAAFEAN
jgi:ribosomal protein S12 methylthiotransferase accessory factor YcaO